MAFCEHCGAELEDNASFCVECGAPVMAKPSDATINMDLSPSPSPSNNDDPGSTASREPTVEPPLPDVTPLTPLRPPYASSPEPYHPQKKPLGTTAIAGLVLGVCLAVLGVGFLFFYLANPLGLTTGIFAGSDAARAAAAEQEKEDLQKQLDEIQNDDSNDSDSKTESPSTVVVVPTNGGGSSGSSGSSGGSSSQVVTLAPDTSSDGYILPQSDDRLLTSSELSGLTDYELYLARNEIYARHGCDFNHQDLHAYFDPKSWYYPSVPSDNFDDGVLSSIERQNVRTIADLERSRGSAYAVG